MSAPVETPTEPEISQEAARAMLAALRSVQTGLALMHHGQGGEWFAGCPVRSVSKALAHVRRLDKDARAAIRLAEGRAS